MSEIAASACVHPTAIIDATAVIMDNVWVGPNVTIGAETVIEPNAVLGYRAGVSTKPLRIGKSCLVATNATIYHSVTLGDGVKIRHNAVVREEVEIGEGTSIGSGCTIEPHTGIGRFCSFHCKVHITDYSMIGDYVFIGPGFVSLSDHYLDYRRPHLHKGYKGVTIGRAARIGGAVLALPGCEVGEETTVGAGSQISGVLKPRTVYLGVPARPVRRVRPEEELGAQP
jgi:UDP-3-O-[3-hydroxymyristoyl] glucosamine N-acyltransferase